MDVQYPCVSKKSEGELGNPQRLGHHYNSGMQTSKKYPGVNVNRLHDD